MAGTTQYKNNWQKENLDRISLTVPRGEKEQIQTHASAHGESVNGFINRAIREAMDRDHIFEQNREEIISLALKKDIDVDIDIDKLEFKKIVEALHILEPYISDIKDLYFRRLYLQIHASDVLLYTKREDGSYEVSCFGSRTEK